MRLHELLFAACAALGACADPVALSTDEHDLKGDLWHPWDETTQTWTRNVVRITFTIGGGCTGTLLDSDWVLTAGHCFEQGPDQDPATIEINHQLADGSWEMSNGVALFIHPQSAWYTNDGATNHDMALVRVSPSLHPGVASLPFMTSSTAGLLDHDVFCAGYGYIDYLPGVSCSADTDCHTTGFVCRDWHGTNICVKGDPNYAMHTSSFHVVKDSTDETIFYDLEVPRDDGHVELPGDSGSSCWGPTGLTGVDKAGNGVNSVRHVSAEVFRDWARGIMAPIREANIPASKCRTIGTTNSLTYTGGGAAWNNGSSGVWVVCPVARPIEPDFADYISVPKMWVYNRSSSSEVCCDLELQNVDGTSTRTPPACTHGSDTDYQTLELGTLTGTASYSTANIKCLVPGQGNGPSGLHGYRVRASAR